MEKELSIAVDGQYCVAAPTATPDSVVYVNAERAPDFAVAEYGGQACICDALILPETWYTVECELQHRQVCQINEVPRRSSAAVIAVCCAALALLGALIAFITAHQVARARKHRLYIRLYKTDDVESEQSTLDLSSEARSE